MRNKDNKNGQYIEGNARIRLAIFAFLCIWIASGFLLKSIAEREMEHLKVLSVEHPEAALNELSNIQLKHLVIPMSIFLTVQGVYLSRLGIKTIRAGIHPPPSVKMPFRSKIQTGTTAKVTAVGYLVAGLCNFIIIALFLMMRHELFKHI